MERWRPSGGERESIWNVPTCGCLQRQEKLFFTRLDFSTTTSFAPVATRTQIQPDLSQRLVNTSPTLDYCPGSESQTRKHLRRLCIHRQPPAATAALRTSSESTLTEDPRENRRRPWPSSPLSSSKCTESHGSAPPNQASAASYSGETQRAPLSIAHPVPPNDTIAGAYIPRGSERRVVSVSARPSAHHGGNKHDKQKRLLKGISSAGLVIMTERTMTAGTTDITRHNQDGHNDSEHDAAQAAGAIGRLNHLKA